VLDIVVHKNVLLSKVIVSDILDSDHLPVVFHLLDHVRTRNLLDSVDKLTDMERFQSLSFELISPRIQSISSEEADKAAGDFTASLSSACRLSTSKITLSRFNSDLPLRKVWQVTPDPECKTAVNLAKKSIRRMTRRKALERWETKV
jgi:hypothetical protein